jgi:hypothetical protein
MAIPPSNLMCRGDLEERRTFNMVKSQAWQIQSPASAGRRDWFEITSMFKPMLLKSKTERRTTSN